MTDFKTVDRNPDEDFIVTFTKDGDNTVVYHHNNEGMYFKIIGYSQDQNRIYVKDANTMNYMMNLLATAGFDSKEAII